MMSEVNAELAMEYLSGDPLLHMDMMESIRRGSARLLFVSGRGVLLYNKDCNAVMMSAADEAEAKRMLAIPESAPMFVAHQRFYIGDVRKRVPFSESITCSQAVYTRKNPLPAPACEAAIRPLDESFLPFVRKNYSQVTEDSYLLGRLRAGVMFGAFLGDRPAGFIGMHEEGSMGMLEVLPEFRRKGIALALETFLSNRLLAEGKVPFAQIIEGNDASLRLHRRLGFGISESTLCWLI